MLRGVAFALMTLFIVAAVCAEQLDVRVDPRVELTSIVFRLAGHPEYNMPNSKSPYADDVEAHFGKHRDHAAVRMARDLRARRGVSFDAVMSMAVHLDDDTAAPKPRTPLDPRPPLLEGRWTVEDAAAFIEALGQFSRDTDFSGFVERHSHHYGKCAAKLSALANSRDFVGFFDRFFGKRPQATFTVVVGMLEGGGNYGVSMRHHDGREEITPVIGIYAWDNEGLPAVGQEILPTIVHEFCHAYTNAFVDRHADALDPIGAKLFAAHRGTMQRQAYGSGRTVLYETMVRACVVHYMSSEVGEAAGTEQLKKEVGRGFRWTPGLADLLAEYATSRDTYKTFEEFMPRVAEYLNAAATEQEAKAARAPKVVAIDPPNGATDLDAAAVTKLVITFDRPMRDQSWSIVGGGPMMPKLGRPTYDAARKVLTVPVTLDPGRQYRFGLNGARFMCFQSADGVPLDPVGVTWTTKAP